jgi:hypothetical protein
MAVFVGGGFKPAPSIHKASNFYASAFMKLMGNHPRL